MSNVIETDVKIIKWVRLIARIWGTLVLVVILFYTVGGIPYIIENLNPREYLNPITLFLSVIGLAIAWRREGLGGMISIIFILANIIFSRWLLSVQDPPFGQLLLFAIPGFLYILYWWRLSKVARS